MNDQDILIPASLANVSSAVLLALEAADEVVTQPAA